MMSIDISVQYDLNLDETMHKVNKALDSIGYKFYVFEDKQDVGKPEVVYTLGRKNPVPNYIQDLLSKVDRREE